MPLSAAGSATADVQRLSASGTRFLHDPANPNSLGHNYVGRVREDHSGILWLASPLGSGLSALGGPNLRSGCKRDDILHDLFLYKAWP